MAIVLDRSTLRLLRPLLLCLIFALVWNARGNLGDIASSIVDESVRLAAACADR